MATDPVCNMTVEPNQAAAKVEYQGTTYYFCSDGCRKAFTAVPENYVARRESPTHRGDASRRGSKR